MTRIWLHGSNGRMGVAIQAIVGEQEGLEIVGRSDVGESNRPTEPVDAVIDFSSITGATDALRIAESAGCALVSGTTGLDDAYFAELESAAKRIPVLHAANMSVGVAILRHLTRTAARSAPDWDVEIVELHHRHKRDSPSGTALALLTSANEGLGRDRHEGLVAARAGDVGPRTDSEIGVFGVRGGDVVGEHTVFHFGAGERLELTHRATDRRIFARGAVRAAQWLCDRPPGRYTIDDVLGLN